jgi:BMFP domain-containing protein YqiC
MLDDLARVAGGALGAAAGMRSEVEARLREQFERILSQMDIVTREEFDAVQAMAVNAREENALLLERLASLESRIAELEKEAKAESKSRPAARSKTKSAPSRGKGGKSVSDGDAGSNAPSRAPSSRGKSSGKA